MEYHKITTLFERDPDTNYRTVIEGMYAKPEFKYLENAAWEFTEKVDGTNIRVILTPSGVEFRGKTDNAQIPPFLLKRLGELFDNFPAAYGEVFPDTPEVILYGEGYGAKIQKGGGNYIRDGVDFVLFDIRIGGFWLERGSVGDIRTRLNLDIVPVIGTGTIADGVDMVKRNYGSMWGDFPAEGIVARPRVQLFNRKGERVIWKLKAKDFK